MKQAIICGLIAYGVVLLVYAASQGNPFVSKNERMRELLRNSKTKLPRSPIKGDPETEYERSRR